MKIKNLLLIIGIILGSYIVLDYRNILDTGWLILSNIYEDTSYYRGSEKWINKYNEAIWLTRNKKYSEAKSLIIPLLNNTNIDKKSEIAELYGDLIYITSGSINDSIHMYERSLSFASNDRINQKIEYLKSQNIKKNNTGSIQDSPSQSGSNSSGSLEKNIKKQELQKIWKQRAEFLSNYNPWSDGSKKNIEKLIESINSDEIYTIYDW